MKSYFTVCEVPLTSKDILESFSYYMASEPDDEKSQSADSFMKQAVMKLEEGTVKMTFHNTLEHLVDETYILFVLLLPCL